MSQSEPKDTADPDRALWRAFFGLCIILAMPIVILLSLQLVSGWGERSLEQNFFIVVLIIIWPLNWAFDKIMLAPWWDGFRFRFFNRKRRAEFANGLSFIALFSILDLETDAGLVSTVSQYVANFAIFFVLLLIANIVWELAASWWKRRKS
jgi:hypothetical protein